MGLSKCRDFGSGFGESGSWVMWWVPEWVGLAWMGGYCSNGFQSISSFFFFLLGGGLDLCGGYGLGV